jgi:DNA-binding NtrC family response regulator
MEQTMIEQALRQARFNKSKAAKAVGLTRHQLYRRMRKYGNRMSEVMLVDRFR